MTRNEKILLNEADGRRAREKMLDSGAVII